MRLNDFLRRRIAATLAVLMIVETLQPVVALALTGGPSQPEVQGFKAIEATNMVDIFTGDFNYNLPLFEIEGYPVNMSYNSNPRMDDEASWVGLGWTLNPGAVNREMRGLPDDFKGEAIVKKFDMREDITVGGSFGVSAELFGIKTLSGSIKQGIFWNNKKGFGSETSISASKSLGSVNASLSLSSNTSSGLDISPSIGLTKTSGKTTASVNAGANINSRQGLKAVSFGFSIKDAATKKAASDPRTAEEIKASPAANTEKKETDNGDPVGYGGGISNEMGGFTYFPTNPMPMYNTSFNFHATIGGEFFGGHPNFLIDGYGSSQRLAKIEEKQYGYGYLYHTEGSKTNGAVLDCNRDGQLMYREDMPNVPLSYGTYDNFSVAGQGVGGQFRLYRNDIGMLHNGYHKNTSSTTTLGIELGFGNAFHAGGDISVTKVENVSEPWTVNNKMRDVIKFTENDKHYEGTYFKETSEKTIEDSVFIRKIGKTNPVFTRLSKQLSTISSERQLEAQVNKLPVGVNAIGSNLQKTERAKRYNVFSYLTSGEQLKTGLDKGVRSYTQNTLTYNSGTCQTPSVFQPSAAKPHHIGEVSVTKSDGSRYVFGLPVYNLPQKEVSFSCIALHQDSAFTAYPSKTDKTPEYKVGRDQFYESQTIPAHAHSYLLTGVLSDDYVDVTGDGISDDDLGNGVKFNYTRTQSAYQWRTPFKKDVARLMAGMKIDKQDDKASYVYGSKEIWYVHSIESRNMVAQFYTSKRDDGYGVDGENGGLNDKMSLQKLDFIKIFSKSDLLANGSAAIPIKTVNFEYDYTLCPNTDNSLAVGNSLATSKGKLTLKKVYFTFGNNGKGKLNAYQFGYKATPTGSTTPFSYEPQKTDRWGFYKQHPTSNPTTPTTFPQYVDYPYTLQNSVEANKNAGAWSMDSITLPSGGTIKVDYESDDYAYVQDKRAGQMFFLKGFASSADTNKISSNLYQQPALPFGFGTPNKFLAVDVSAYTGNVPSIHTPSDLAHLFLADVGDLFFKVKLKLTPYETSKEFVTGYLSCDKTALQYSNGTLFIPVTTITEGSNKIHPITLAALQTLRLNLPDLAYSDVGNPDVVNAQPTGLSFSLILAGLKGFVTGTMELIKGFNKIRVQKGWCKEVDISGKNAWVRLSNPNFKKLGGGTRVKTITVDDKWIKENVAAAGTKYNSNYVQKFTYTTLKDGKEISSGVASYEPALGGEEISLKQPLPYSESVKLAPDNSYYTETPIGESFYPSPGIGYSEVRVESTDKAGKNVGTGYTISKFYTAKDFPTITDFTNIVDGTVKVKPDVISKIFKFSLIDQRGVSQGFKIETNDMHGKPKEEAIYNQNGAVISATNYTYKTDNPDAKTLHLKNEVLMVNPDGTLVTRNMGVETDMWQEMQEESSNMQNIGLALNVESFLGFIFPIVIPVPLPIYQSQNKGIKSSITVKHIRRMGIVDKIVKTTDGSTQSTQNMVYDIETGDVLLTRTENEYNDPLYNFTYPAHWVYDAMGSAYKNIGNTFKGVKFNENGIFTEGVDNDPAKYFTVGDELIITKETTSTIKDSIYYVMQYNPYDVNKPITQSNTPNQTLRVFDGKGNPFNGLGFSYTVKIKRSGRRNKAALPVGSIACLKNPIINNKIDIVAATQVIQADAKEYTDLWKMRCTKGTITDCDVEIDTFAYKIINPYIVGLRGNWRGFRGFLNYNDRNVTASNAPSNIRRDGYIPAFAPYWKYNTDTKFWASTGSSKWVRSDSIRQYDGRGNEIESSDANNIVSSASFGFNNTQVVAVTANSLNQEMTYDSFEDYAFKNDCNTPTTTAKGKNIAFFRNRVGSTLDPSVSHTGNYSMALNGNAQLKLSGALDNSCYQPNTAAPARPAAAAAAFLAKDYKNIYNGCADCLPEFGLLRDKRYVMSVWVASTTSLKTNERPLSMKVSISSELGTIPVNLRPQGPVIDGWQKLEGEFMTASSGRAMFFTFSNLSPELKGYIDDVRILPFNAKMKAYAYDARSRRLMAELDENHYATFYEYDDEGQLVRIKRETETGVQTVKEARNYLIPNN